MKLKFYISGLITILAVFMFIILCACLVDVKAEAKSNTEDAEYTNEKKDIDNEDSADGDRLTDNEVCANKESCTDGECYTDKENCPEGADCSDGSCTLTSAKDYTNLQETYSALVSRYNGLVKKCQSNSLGTNEDIKDVLNQTADVLTQMGDTNLETADDDDIAELIESASLLDDLLDEIEKAINAYLGIESEDLSDETALTDETTSETVVANYEMPDFTISTISGESFTLSEQGGNVVVVSFFATWCSPCHEELNILQDINEEYPEVKIIAIGCGESNSSVKKYMKNNGYSFMAGADPSSVSDAYGVSAIPYTVVFGKDGSVIKEFEGLHDASDYENAIKKGL